MPHANWLFSQFATTLIGKTDNVAYYFMANSDDISIGAIEWHDLTVPDAESLKDFYHDVVGWDIHAQSMGEYDDYSMLQPNTETAVAGVCHAKGPNANLPAQWLMYVRVASVTQSIETCLAKGGKLISGPTNFGQQHYCVIQDPQGAVLALISER